MNQAAHQRPRQRRVALLIENFYEDMEALYPWYRLREEGFRVDLVGSEANAVYKGKYGYPLTSELASKELKPEDYDAVIIPGGYAPDHIRRCPASLNFVRQMDRRERVIAAICHGGWILCSACQLKGRRVTSFFAIQDDLINAGALWQDAEVVVDGHLVTSRKPSDLIAFCREIIRLLR
jgi:protease I